MTKIIIGVLVVLAAVGGYVYVSKDRTTPLQNTNFTSSVEYLCQGETTVGASFGEGVARVTFPDNRVFTLEQVLVDDESGTKFANEGDQVVLWVRDGSAFIDENGKSLYAGCRVKEEPVATADSVVGCYVATLGKDVYSLKIDAQSGETFAGTLVFDNFQKDSSSGIYMGTYTNGILLGDYAFQSEGTNSVMQVIFRRVGNDFVRGFGAVNENGDKFADLNNITYDFDQTFKTSENCATPNN